MSSRATVAVVVVSVVTGVGLLAVLAALIELSADDSPPPPGWTNYTPPWPIPVLTGGLALVAAGALAGGLLLVCRARVRRRTR